MKTFSPKSQTDTQQARNHPILRETESTSWLIDRGPEAIAQRKLQVMTNQVPQVQRLAQLHANVSDGPRVQAQSKLQATIDNSPRQMVQRQQLQHMFGPVAHLQEGVSEEKLQMQTEHGTPRRQSLDEDGELLQGKREPVQRQGELEGEEGLLQRQCGSGQRQGLEDEELVQGKFAASATRLPQQHRNVTQTVAQLLAIQLPSPVPADPSQWQVDTNDPSRVHLLGWIDEAAAYFNFAALGTLWNQLNGIPVLVRTPFETYHWLYTHAKIAQARTNFGVLPSHLNAAYDNLKRGAVVLSFQQQVAAMRTHLPFPVGDGIITNYLNQTEQYTVATIANAKLQGAIGHHIFIEFADGTISEYAWPQTKATYPKSQIDRRTTTRAQIARLKMAARYHGFAGKAGRYYIDSPAYTPRFQGYVYFPWYQDCFHWVDVVLSDAGEPPAHLVRMTKGAVFKWGGVTVLLAGAAYLTYAIFGGGKSE